MPYLPGIYGLYIPAFTALTYHSHAFPGAQIISLPTLPSLTSHSCTVFTRRSLHITIFTYTHDTSLSCLVRICLTCSSLTLADVLTLPTLLIWRSHTLFIWYSHALVSWRLFAYLYLTFLNFTFFAYIHFTYLTLS